MVNSWFKVIVLSIATATLLMGCGGGVSRNSSSANGDSKQQGSETTKRVMFSMPQIPAAITGVENRRQYLAEHYWDGFKFESEEYCSNDSLMGVAVAGYIQVLLMNSPATVEQSVDAALGRALKVGYDQFETLSSKLEDYLYDPNSPMRNEELYIYVLRYTVDKAPLEDDIYRVRSRHQLEMVLKNRVGMVATDFTFEDRAGNRSTMHSIGSKYTLLYFNIPDCEDCIRVKDYISNSPRFAKMCSAGELTVLGVYAERDIDLWRKAKYPSIILNGVDPNSVIEEQKLYDLKAMPTLYLLDSAKRVVLKDRSIEEVDSYLSR